MIQKFVENTADYYGFHFISDPFNMNMTEEWTLISICIIQVSSTIVTGYDAQSRNTYAPAEFERIQYLFAKKRGTEAVKLREEIEALKVVEKNKLDECKKLIEEMKVEKQKVTGLTLNIENSLVNLQAERKKNADLITASAKIEQDMAKVRAAVGEIKYNEILGIPKP